MELIPNSAKASTGEPREAFRAAAEAAPAIPALSRWVVNRSPEPRALEIARLALLDTTACMIAGRTAAQTRKLKSMLATTGSTHGVGSAALLLGVAGHALEFDNYESSGSTHPSVVILAALIALTERGEYSLREFLVAYVVGYEVILATGKALGHGHNQAGWHATSTIGVVGAAAASARLLGLGPQGVSRALSLAMSQSAGLKGQFGFDAKALQAGLAARAGVEAALLAQVGFSASPDVADGTCGFAGMFGALQSAGWQSLSEKGVPKLISHSPYLKPWPCCIHTYRAIEAAERIANLPGFDVRQMVNGTIRVSEPNFKVAGFIDPCTIHEARFSMLYCASVALADRRVEPSSFEAPTRARTDVRAVMGKLRLEPYAVESIVGDLSPEAPDTVTVEMRDGNRLSETVDHPKGSPQRPLTSTEICRKFVDCGGSADAARSLLDTSLESKLPTRLLGLVSVLDHHQAMSRRSASTATGAAGSLNSNGAT